VVAQLNAAAQLERRTSGMGEVDRVLGGGLVPGSVVLVGGEPGVGKSTLLLQLAGSIANGGGTVLVCSAEESAQQVAMRAERVGVTADGVLVLAEDDVDAAIAAADETRPDLLIIDSIQTVGVSDMDSAPGSVSQVRESASRLVRYAKERGVATILVGHVTKDGGLAGPKLLEHMVDVVLSLEGDPDRGFRALRSFKNRFGATHTVALFDMRNEGMVEVEDPSEAFLAEWQSDVAGTVVFPAVEGRRSVLVEIQALVTSSSQVQPRRSVRGVAPSRVHQILAVLDRHCGIPLADHEVYVNVVGGWTLDEPACDLPVALALASSRLDLPLGSVAAWGEIGLAGEVRPVPFEARRREEAERLKIGTVVAPTQGQRLSRALAEAGLVPSPSR
jgi:DNA repair protein RadA/Sms